MIAGIMHKKKILSNTAYLFIVVCVVALLFVFSPLLIRLPCVYDSIRWVLSGFINDEYKSTYIEMMGALLGALVAITGAIWTQKVLDKHKYKEQIVRDAHIVYSDFKCASDCILELMKDMYPVVNGNSLVEDEFIINYFHRIRKKYYICFEPDWKQLVVDLRYQLTMEEIQLAKKFYRKIVIISNWLELREATVSYSEDSFIYALMHECVDVEFSLSAPISYEITLSDDIVSLIDKVSQLAKV